MGQKIGGEYLAPDEVIDDWIAWQQQRLWLNYLKRVARLYTLNI